MDKGAMPEDIRDETIERMMRQYGAAVYRMCYVYLREKTLAEDAGQDTFIKAYRSLDTFVGKHERSEKAWLMRIAINTCKDLQRSTWFKSLGRREPLEGIPEPASDFEMQDRFITEEVMKLPTKLREVVLLHYYQEMTYDEIMHILGIGKTTVFQRLTKAKKLLRDRLEGWCGDEQSGY